MRETIGVALVYGIALSAAVAGPSHFEIPKAEHVLLAQSPVGRPITLTMEATVSGGSRPVVSVLTNLPETTQLSVILWKPWLPNAKERMAIGMDACGGPCGLTATPKGGGTGDAVEVKNGRFTAGPFSDQGTPLRPGTYVLEVFGYLAFQQPPQVGAILGSMGENAVGPLIGGCCLGSHASAAEIQNERLHAQESTKVLGASFYYGRYITIDVQK